MLALARWMARILWRAILWLMRRPWMKAFQRNSILILPKKYREKGRISQIKQNRFARKTGLSMLTFMMSLVVGSLLVTGSFLIAMSLYEHGYLTIPRRLRRQLSME